VHLLSGDALIVAGQQHSGPRYVAPLLADGLRAAHDDVIDQRRIQITTLGQGAKDLPRQLDGADLVQRAVGATATARRPHMVVNEGIGHRGILVGARSGVTAHNQNRRPKQYPTQLRTASDCNTCYAGCKELTSKTNPPTSRTSRKATERLDDRASTNSCSYWISAHVPLRLAPPMK